MNDEIKKEIIEMINSLKENYNEPVILYSSQIIGDIMEKVHHAVDKCISMKCLYSIKANLNHEVISVLTPLIDGFDVASWREYEIIKSMGKSIFASGYAYTDEQIIELVNNEKFDFISVTQLKNVSEKIKNKNIGIRISGQISKLEHTEQKTSRFGCVLDDIKDIKNICEENNLSLERIHIHLGEKNLDVLESCVNEIRNWCNAFNSIVQINIGGGWDYLYDNGEFERALRRFSNSFPNKIVIIEPGSLLVRKSGMLVARVIDYKINENNEGSVVLNVSSFNLSSWYIPRLIAIKRKGKAIPFSNYNIYGNTCFENDIFQVNQKMTIGMDDTLFFYPVGAYYNSTNRKLHNLSFPKEILI